MGAAAGVVGAGSSEVLGARRIPSHTVARWRGEREKLIVTDATSAHVAQVLDDHGLPEGIAVRVVSEGWGIALRQDSERPGDTTFQHEGRTVLLLGAEVSELLTEETLDVEGTELTLRCADHGE